MTEITSKPDHGETVMVEGVATPRLQLFYDDIERNFNDNLLGDSVKFPIYTVGSLPDINENEGGMIFVKGTVFLNSIPVFASFPILPSPLLTISSVTNAGGIANFIVPANPPEINQQITISGFDPAKNYNGTFFVTSRPATLEFQISSISFQGSESVGKFRKDANWRDVFSNQIIV